MSGWLGTIRMIATAACVWLASKQAEGRARSVVLGKLQSAKIPFINFAISQMLLDLRAQFVIIYRYYNMHSA